MGFNKDSGKITYTVVNDFDHVIDEKGNMTINLRQLYWGDNPNKVRLDLRRWSINANGEEVPGKGVSFMTEEGPHTLTETLIKTGYGDTRNIITNLTEREDFRPALNSVLGKGDEYYNEKETREIEEFFDPRTTLF